MSYYEIRDKKFEAVYNGMMNIYPPHFHSDIEILYVLSGGINISVDGKDYLIKKGDAALVFPNVIHSINDEPAGMPALKLLVCLCGAQLCGCYMNTLLTMKTDTPVINMSELSQEMDFAAEHITRAYSENDMEAAAAVMPYLIMLMLRKMNIIPDKVKTENDIPHKIAVFIAKHYNENIHLSDIAHELNISVSYASHVLSHDLRTSLRLYLNALRTSRAAELLKSSSFGISDICYECGFENERTFRRSFKNIYGMTPGEYRCSDNVRPPHNS